MKISDYIKILCCSVLIAFLALAGCSVEVNPVTKTVAEQKQASSLPEQIEVLCITGKLFVRDKYGHGTLLQVGEGSSISVACKEVSK